MQWQGPSFAIQRIAGAGIDRDTDECAAVKAAWLGFGQGYQLGTRYFQPRVGLSAVCQRSPCHGTAIRGGERFPHAPDCNGSILAILPNRALDYSIAEDGLDNFTVPDIQGGVRPLMVGTRGFTPAHELPGAYEQPVDSSIAANKNNVAGVPIREVRDARPRPGWYRRFQGLRLKPRRTGVRYQNAAKQSAARARRD
jgi:hypothetical protein